ncbi:MAG TPA: E3 ubiquitin ligase family protein [Roseiflexaceae bacterium]|nr:E3 ubiquitin ligase family protein [Roseiflexaceae bacterium]
MTFIGILFLLAAVALFFGYRSQQAKLRAIGATETYTAALLTQIHQRIVGSLGGEALAEGCEVSGMIECDEPLRGPVSGQALVAYSHVVSREFEEPVTRTNTEGKSETKVERGSEVIESTQKRVAFWIRDETGRVLVDPEGATIEDQQELANRFEEANDPGLARRRNLGKRSRESGLPVGVRVFIFGCAVDRGGQLVITRPPKGGRFLISRKSEQELVSSAEGSARTLRLLAIVSGVIGGLTLIYGLFT